MKKKLYAGVLLLLLIFSVGQRGQSVSNRADAIINQLKSKYGIEFTYKNPPAPTWNVVTYTRLSERDQDALIKYLELFAEEFNKYPEGFLQRVDLREVVFVKDLHLYQYRAAVPDYYKEYLFYDIYIGSNDAVYQRHCIHHEFYHMIEEEINGDVYYKDPRWPSAGYSYIGEGQQAYSSGTDVYSLIHPEPGFINLYSTYALEEDKAEIYASLFIPSEASLLYQWDENDNLLNRKIDYIKRFLKTLDSGFTDDYWEEIVE